LNEGKARVFFAAMKQNPFHAFFITSKSARALQRERNGNLLIKEK
jgi:hypothetical protein